MKKKIPDIVYIIILKSILRRARYAINASFCILCSAIALIYGLLLNTSTICKTYHPTAIISHIPIMDIERGYIMSWHAKPTGSYSIYSTEGVENAYMMLYQFRSYGYTDNAISAIVGNMCAEGGLNPWRWQSDIIVGPEDFWENTHGYGLAGFTPAGKYIEDTDAQGYAGYAPNYLNHQGNATDGAAQCQFIAENPQYYQTHAAYPLTFQQFKVSNQSPSYLSDTWLYNFEQPAHPEDTQQYRRDCSEYWYQLFQGAPYYDPDSIIPLLVAMKIIK